jgi:hypothetical protein
MIGQETARKAPEPANYAPKPRLQGPFEWTPARTLALQLCFQDELNDEEIARLCGISRRTLSYWKTNPVFAAAWQRLGDQYAESLIKNTRNAVLRGKR